MQLAFTAVIFSPLSYFPHFICGGTSNPALPTSISPLDDIMALNYSTEDIKKKNLLQIDGGPVLFSYMLLTRLMEELAEKRGRDSTGNCREGARDKGGDSTASPSPGC